MQVIASSYPYIRLSTRFAIYAVKSCSDTYLIRSFDPGFLQRKAPIELPSRPAQAAERRRRNWPDKNVAKPRAPHAIKAKKMNLTLASTDTNG